jgi:hypothetical protein
MNKEHLVCVAISSEFFIGEISPKSYFYFSLAPL